MHLVQCKTCFKSATITEDDVDVHLAVDATGCSCCPEDHHHGRAAEDADPCRPLLITLLGGSPPGSGVPAGKIVRGEVVGEALTLEGGGALPLEGA